MCDYSLDFTASRPAKVGDKLVTTAFPTSLTQDFLHSASLRWRFASSPAQKSRSRMKSNMIAHSVSRRKGG